MPPKKDDKKVPAKKPVGPVTKVIEPADYLRKPVSMSPVEVMPLSIQQQAVITNIESLFLEWNVDGEPWADPIVPEAMPELKFPDNIFIASQSKSIRTLAGIDLEANSSAPVAVDPKAKSKKDVKKSKGESEMTENVLDDSGRVLPRVFMDTASKTARDGPIDENQVLGFVPAAGHWREWSQDQLNKMKKVEKWKSKLEFHESASSQDTERAQREYDNFIAKLGGNLIVPDGPVRDSFICSAFDIIMRFAPTILTSQDAHVKEGSPDACQYLWRSIYPKTASGRPCYNPSGRYCVRLFLAGKWRKVTVSDVFPVKADDSLCLARTTEPLELWPSILSKAIYTAYNVCGYADTLSVLLPKKKSYSDANPQLAASLVSFAVHALTGWDPSSPWSLPITVKKDPTRMKNLVQEMVQGGALMIDPQDAPGISEPRMKPALPVLLNGKEIMKTKKQFKEEYQTREEERATVTAAIHLRESQIARIVEKLKSPFSECFALAMMDHELQELCVHTILAISASSDDVNSIAILVEWTVIPDELVPRAPVVPGPAWELDHPPLPTNTHISCRWITMDELISNNTFIVSFNTHYVEPFKAALGWHWTPVTAALPTAEAGKGKDKAKPAPAAAAKPGKAEEVTVYVSPDTLCGHPGDMPPCILSVDPTSFFVSAADLVVAAASVLADGAAASEGDEAAMAVAAQSAELASLAVLGKGVAGAKRKPSNDVLKPKSAFLSLSVMLHGDLERHAVDLSMSPAMNAKLNMAHNPMDNPVLILQELRSDDEEPLVMRVELSTLCPVPIARTTFQIPAEKLQMNAPMVFWVRLISKASLYISFSCGAPVTVGEAGSTWQQKLNRTAIIRQGDCPLTRGNSEQLLFRMPLQLPADNKQSQLNIATVTAFLHISDKAIARNVSFVVQGEEESYTLPTIQGTVIKLKRGCPLKLIARCFPLKGLQGVPPFKWKLTLLSNMPLVDSPAFEVCPALQTRYSGFYIPNNRLTLFRDVLVVDKSSPPLALRLTLLPAPFKRLLTSGGKVTYVTPDYRDVEEGICLIVRTYRKSDRKLICEYRARGVMQLYSIPVASFLEDLADPGALASQPSVVEKGAPAAGKAKKEDKTKPVVSGVEILVECFLDEQAMIVPGHWRSRMPHYFDCFAPASVTAAGSAAKVEEQQGSGTGGGPGKSLQKSFSNMSLLSQPAPELGANAEFCWQLDVLSGTVQAMSHDTVDLERCLAMKNSWEEKCEGRTEQALAAANAYAERKIARQARELLEEAHSGETNDGMTLSEGNLVRHSRVTTPGAPPSPSQYLEYLAQALAKEQDELRNRYETLASTKPYTEYRKPGFANDSPDYTFEMVSPASVEAGRVMRAQELKNTEQEMAELTSRYQDFNSRLKNKLKTRIEEISAERTIYADDFTPLWKEREKFRVDIDNKNTALQFLLEKANEAVQAAIDKEFEEANPDAKGKKKPNAKDAGKAKKK